MKRFMQRKNAPLRKRLDETNDCSVIALSIVARMTYNKAHEICRIQGRKHRKGMYTYDTFAMLRHLGFKIERVQQLVQKSGSRFTPKTIGNKLKRGYFLCFCNGHVFAVVNGDVEDWSNGRQHRITHAYKVTRTRN